MPRKSTAATAPSAAEEMEKNLGEQESQTDPEIAEMLEDQPGIHPEGDKDNPVSQTETESAEFMADDPSLQADNQANNADSQTEPENEPNIAEANGISGSSDISDASVEDENAPLLHTGIEDSDDEPGDASRQPDNPDTIAAPQSDSKNDDTGSGSPEESPKKTRRRTVKSRSGEMDENQTPTESESAAPPKPARRRKRAAPVLAIDEQRTVETQEDKLKNDLLDLVESMKGKKVLTGTIQGVERPADNPNLSFAVIYHGAFKVIIPAEEAVHPPNDFRDRSPADVMHYMLTKRLGAEVDFIVKGVDPKSGIAAASRLDAMALKRRQYYFGTDRDGNNMIYEGLSAEARVISVIRAGIFVDLFGVEAYIPLLELSYQRWIDAAAHFQPGQRVLVKILKLDRNDRDNIHVSVSVKQAGENPYEQALKRYSPGCRYVGTVSIVDTNGVFVSLEGGIDCLCSYPKRGRPPRGSRVTVKIIGVNHENNRIWGAITHMTTTR